MFLPHTPATLIFMALVFHSGHSQAADWCPKGFSFPPEGSPCYMVSATQKTWLAARLYCRQFNSDLVKIESPLQEEFVKALIRQSLVPDKGYWIGLNDILEEGSFRWLDKTGMTYGRFQGGQPNGRENQGCVIDADSYNGWHDACCFCSYSVVCQYNRGGVHSPTEIKAVHSDLSLPELSFSHVLSRQTTRTAIHCAALCLRNPACDIYAFRGDRRGQTNCLLLIMGYKTNRENFDSHTKIYVRI